MSRTAPVLCGGVLLALLAGCGQSSLHSGSNDETSPPPAPATSTSPAPPSPAAALADRVGERIGERSSVRFTMFTGRSTVRGAIALDAPVAVRSALARPAGAGETIRVGRQVYLTSPRIVADGLGTPWALLGGSAVSAPYASPGGLLRRSAQAVPATVLDAIRTAGTPAGGNGPRHAFRLDLRKLGDGPLAAAGRAGATEARAELLLDRTGLPVRMRTVVFLPDGPVSTTVRYGAWDAPVDIVAPEPGRFRAPGA